MQIDLEHRVLFYKGRWELILSFVKLISYIYYFHIWSEKKADAFVILKFSTMVRIFSLTLDALVGILFKQDHATRHDFEEMWFYKTHFPISLSNTVLGKNMSYSLTSSIFSVYNPCISKLVLTLRY